MKARVVLGWLFGWSLAFAIVLIFPTVGFLPAVLLSAGLTGLGGLLGAAAER